MHLKSKHGEHHGNSRQGDALALPSPDFSDVVCQMQWMVLLLLKRVQVEQVPEATCESGGNVTDDSRGSLDVLQVQQTKDGQDLGSMWLHEVLSVVFCSCSTTALLGILPNDCLHCGLAARH